MNLRPYQIDAIERVRQAMWGGARRVVLVAPTGSGKTVMATEVVRRAVNAGRRGLWLAHRAELVDQAADTLTAAGLQVGAICASAETPPNPYAPVQVATVQTLLARRERPPADIIVADECVPGDTVVGGQRADRLTVGDYVDSWSGTDVVRRKVTHVFTRTPHSLRTVFVEEQQLVVTDSHPVWVSGKGFVEARHVEVGDMCRVRGLDPVQKRARSEDVLREMREHPTLENNGPDEPEACRSTNDGSQPNGLGGGAGENVSDAAFDGARAINPRRERERGDQARISLGCEDWTLLERDRLHTQEDGRRLSDALQDRRRGAIDSAGHRARWVEPLSSREEGSRPEKANPTRIARVDRIEVHEPGSDGTFGGRCPDGLVYNFEIEGEHNYFANGILTHNCHHFCDAAATFASLLRDYPDALVLGPTATPERGDACGLRSCFDGLVVAASVSELTELGHLVPCEVLRPARALEPGQIAQSPVEAYLEHAAGRRAIVFVRSVPLAEQYAAEFIARGVQAHAVTAETPWAERRLWIDAFRRGRVPVLTNVAVLTEGFDAPETSCVVLARGCGSAGLYLQMVGRALRPAPGKRDALLLDLRGVSHDHGRPEDEREYSLDGRGIRLCDPQSYCRVCGAARTPPEPCSACGYAPSSDSEVRPDKVTGDPLVKYARIRQDDDTKRACRLARWLRDAASHGHKEGAALWKYRAVYGAFPTPQVRRAAQTYVEEIRQTGGAA